MINANPPNMPVWDSTNHQLVNIYEIKPIVEPGARITDDKLEMVTTTFCLASPHKK